jgi:prealbumin domain-containing protein/Big-like domain-containing protein/PKD domain-containing protein
MVHPSFRRIGMPMPRSLQGSSTPSSLQPRMPKPSATKPRGGLRWRPWTAALMAGLITLLQVATPALASGVPPVAVDQSATTPSRPLDLNLNATDFEFDPLTFTIGTPPAHGALGDCSSGSCIYTPTAGYTGPDSFTWKANDGTSDSNVGTFTITVTANQPPVAEDQSETSSQPLTLLLNASDLDGDPLTFTIITPPTNGTLDDCTGGTCTYTPATGFLGDDSFTWKANDGLNDSNIASFTITVIPNQPPLAQDQSVTTGSTTLFVILLASDPELDPLTYAIVSAPAHGTLDDCTDGSCTYTPATAYVGPDSFTWKANDGTNDSNIATFSIIVRQSWSALQIAQSIASSSANVTGASFVTAPPVNVPNGVYSSALGGFPLDGSTFGVLTSGDVDSIGHPGTFASSNDGGSTVRGNTDLDVSILKIDLTVPQGSNCLSFNFRFLSEEFPVYVGSAYNDAFIAELDTSDWTTSGSAISAPHNIAFDSSNDVVSINSTGLGGMTPANGAGTAFDGTSGTGDSSGGATGLLAAATPVTPGAHSLYLSIFDQGDHSLDTAVFLDNLRVESVPNPAVDCKPGATQAAHLTLVKLVSNAGGGTALETAWTLNATGPTPISGATGSPAVTNAIVSPGAYNLAETNGPTGYDASDWVCTDGTLTGSSLVLAADDNATCTIINTFVPIPPTAHLTLVKTVDNAGGGTALDTDWTLSANGPTFVSGTTGSVSVTNVVVIPGTYILGETGPAGYSATVSCTGGTLTGVALVLAVDESATCTINNTFVPGQPTAHLTLVKTVDNTAGGTTSASSWTLHATGPTPISGGTGSAAVTNAVVSPGTYTLAESGGSPNYSASAWSCVGGTLTGSSLVLVADESATCTIVNTFVPEPPTAHLTLVKTVDNAGGGTALETAWTLSADGPTPISGSTGSAAVTNAVITPGTYTLGESGGPTGYTATAWSCTGGALTGTSLLLAAGETASCTITNTFVPLLTHLTMVKKVDNTGGGTALDTAWTLTAAGPTPISGSTGGAAVTNAVVTPGTYALSESGPTGYSASAWSCTGGTLTGASLVLVAGDTASCTIINTFVPPLTHLTLVKKVDNTAGGAGLATAWTLSASGPTPITGTTGSTAVTNAVVTPGTYTLAESGGPIGYTASAWSCTGGTLTGSSLVLVAGDTASCSITNTFVNTPPTVTVSSGATGPEGGPISLDGTVTDPDAGDTLTTVWSYAPSSGVDAGATCAFAVATAVDTTITCTDDGVYTVTLSANDGHNPSVAASANVIVTNANPTVDITAPLAGASFTTGTSVSVTATLADAGANDTLTCSIAWGDGTTTSPASLVAGVCSASHSYATAGDKTIVVTATDDDGGTGSDSVAIKITTPGGPCSATDPTTTVERISPPVSVKLNRLTSNTCVRLFDERQDVTLAKSLKVDITKPGTYDEKRDLTPASIPTGTIVDSHLLHADNIGSIKVRLTGSVTFDADILGVIVLDRNLDKSDYLGSPTTSYPTKLHERGLELTGALANGGDLVTISADRRTLTFNVRFSSVLDQIRVITANAPSG